MRQTRATSRLPQRARQRAQAAQAFAALLATARQLRRPGGCAWDRAQTLNSLLPYVVEETWEVFEAIRRRRWHSLQEELGDVLYGVLCLALIGERQGRCTVTGLLRHTRGKMRRRHPHVFGRSRAGTPAEALRHWEASKRREGPRAHSPTRELRRTLIAWWDWLLAHPEVWARSTPARAPSCRPGRLHARRLSRPR